MIHVVASLGPNPAPITELAWYLVRCERQRIGSVHLAVESTRSQRYLEEELMGGLAMWPELSKLLGDALPPQPTLVYPTDGLPNHERSAAVAERSPELFWRTSMGALEAAGPAPVVFALTGGRRRATSAAEAGIFQLLARPDDRLVDVRVSESAAEGGSGFFFPEQHRQDLVGRFRYASTQFAARDVNIHLDEVRLPSLRAFVPHPMPTTYQQALKACEATLLRARPPRVLLDLPGMRLTVDEVPLALTAGPFSLMALTMLAVAGEREPRAQCLDDLVQLFARWTWSERLVNGSFFARLRDHGPPEDAVQLESDSAALRQAWSKLRGRLRSAGCPDSALDWIVPTPRMVAGQRRRIAALPASHLQIDAGNVAPTTRPELPT